jgi:hypothetical protein
VIASASALGRSRRNQRTNASPKLCSVLAEGERTSPSVDWTIALKIRAPQPYLKYARAVALN